MRGLAACLIVPWTVDHDMKSRVVLGALALAGVPLLLTTPARADPTPLGPANQTILPTDIYKPVTPEQEQDGVAFHNVDVVSFLPGVVDED